MRNSGGTPRAASRSSKAKATASHVTASAITVPVSDRTSTSAGLPRPPLARFVGFGAPPPPPTPATIRAQLQRDLLDPDSEIAPSNRMFRAVHRDGTVTTGRLLNLDPFTVQLFDSKERLVTFERSQLREFGPVKSAMPSYRDKLTAQELSDLVAYLASLKGQVK